MSLEAATRKEREGFTQRLRECLRRSGRAESSSTALAREFNRVYSGTQVTTNAVRKWLTGQSIPTQDKLRVLADLLGVRTQWLRYGNGYIQQEPDLPGETESQSRSTAFLHAAHLSEQDLQFISSVLEMSERSRRVMYELAELLTERHGKQINHLKEQ